MNTLNTMIPMSRMIDAAFGHACQATRDENHSPTASPRADVLEGTGEYRIVMDMPGVKTDDLDISLENQLLTVQAKRSLELPEGFEPRRRERAGNATFSRSFSLSNAVEAENISARMEDGQLWLTLPKSEKSLPRKIEVK
jgi:HSP20 family protein